MDTPRFFSSLLSSLQPSGSNVYHRPGYPILAKRAAAKRQRQARKVQRQRGRA